MSYKHNRHHPTSTERATRIQTSILNAAEKRLLVWLAERQPSWVTSDLLTYIGVAGALICGLGFALSGLNINYLWLSSAGLLINWYGDSLDGTLARVRRTQRPKYGFFIDHSVDALTIALMCVGAGLSPLLRLDVALGVLSAYLAISVYTYVCQIVGGPMRLTYGKLGPTEFRLIVVIANTLFIYTPWRELSFTIGATEFSLFDLVGLCITAVIVVLWATQWFSDRRHISALDPLRKAEPASRSKPAHERRQRA